MLTVIGDGGCDLRPQNDCVVEYQHMLLSDWIMVLLSTYFLCLPTPGLAVRSGRVSARPVVIAEHAGSEFAAHAAPTGSTELRDNIMEKV